MAHGEGHVLPDGDTFPVTWLRSKVVDIDAIQFDGTTGCARRIVDWVEANGGHASYEVGAAQHVNVNGTDEEFKPATAVIYITTLEGVMECEATSWVFRGTEGEFYPCKDSVKQRKYDEVV